MNDLKPFKHGEEGTHYVCQEVLELKGGKATCCGCSGHKCKKPKPMKRIKKEVEKKKHIHRYKVYGSTAVCKCGQIKVKSSPKPTKIKKLVIKEDWSEVTFEQQKDRLNVHMRYFEDDDNGGKWEGGSSSFSVPLKKLKDYLLSH